VTGTLTRYRVMATVVGVLLIVLILVGMPLKYLLEDGSDLQEVGKWITSNLGVAHGWLYMIFLVTAFLLSRKAGWELGFTVVTLLCGTVPILSFWAEHRATARVRAEHPELAGSPA
jgi:integral membrane protein